MANPAGILNVIPPTRRTTTTAGPRPLRIGFLPLTDAAPFLVAERLGLFTQRGLRVELTREIGWATIREKIIYGELDAAPAPAPILWSAQLGLGCPATDVLTALVLNLHGNALTLSTALWEAGARDGATLRAVVRARANPRPLTLGIVFPFSSHHLLVRGWLQSAGFAEEREVRIVVVPPAQMFRNLTAGTLDGFCSGEPWNSVAVDAGAGWCATWSSAREPGHVEKILMVTRRFADTRASEHAALVAALLEACAWCDEPQNREKLPELLADARYLNIPAPLLAPALLGRIDCGHGRIEHVPDFLIFHRGEANIPTPAKAAALQRALGATGLISPAAAADPELPRRLFREDLHREILHQPPTNEIVSTTDPRGVARV